MQNHVERFCADYVDIETAAIHVPGQIPNQRTWLKSLIDSIDACMDLKIFAWVAAVTNTINGTSDDFETTVTILLLENPLECDG